MEMEDRSGQPIQSGDDQDIMLSGIVETGVQLWPRVTGPAADFQKDFVAIGKPTALDIEMLIPTTHASVPNPCHAMVSCNRKS
jgi:hypothetical protein